MAVKGWQEMKKHKKDSPIAAEIPCFRVKSGVGNDAESPIFRALGKDKEKTTVRDCNKGTLGNALMSR